VGGGGSSSGWPFNGYLDDVDTVFVRRAGVAQEDDACGTAQPCTDGGEAGWLV
jgi:hypothetical protein